MTKRERFRTRLGDMEAVWEDGELSSLCFSEEPAEASQAGAFVSSVQRHLEGERQDFSAVPLREKGLSSFAREVYRAARAIPPGSLSTYGRLASSVGRPGSARAVGAALARNPFLLVVPCHRITAGNGALGGFSAPGGVLTKELMLACEGVGVESLWQPGEIERGREHLARCPRLGPVVSAVGPCSLSPLLPDDPFGALARSVLYQQLATSAARAIEGRVRQLGHGRFPPAAELAALSDEKLREAGVSGPKIATLRRLAEATLEGRLQPESLRLLPNRQVEERISGIKGLGSWSAQMFLLFHLGRRDVFPPKDLGIRKAMQKLFRTAELPKPEFMQSKAKRWAPYRSLASWYLWRSLELPS